jgi:predicted MPP superfamily phosphohydrolase
MPVGLVDDMPPPHRPRRLTRRQLLLRAAAGATAAAGGVAAYAHFVEPFWPQLVRLPMDLPRLGPALEGFRLVQISDLHMSRSMSSAYLKRQLQRCTALRPDLIVVTGDLLTWGEFWQVDALDSLMGYLQARCGVLAILGNHDYDDDNCLLPAEQRRRGVIAERLTGMLQRHGIRVLRNEAHPVTRGGDTVQFVGLEDVQSDQFAPAAAFNDATPDLPCVALSHNPDTIVALQHLPCDWVLAGHTHGGQVDLPFYGPPVLPIRYRQYAAGLFTVNGRRLYVNRGLGFLRQVRFNCRPEITEFTLTRRG